MPKTVTSQFRCACKDKECQEIGCTNLAGDLSGAQVCYDCKRGKHAGDYNFEARKARWND